MTRTVSPNTKKCVVCNVRFHSAQPKAKVCGEECREKSQGIRHIVTRSKSDTFSLTEVVVSASLLRDGWDVFRPLHAHTKYDLIVMDKDTQAMFPIEVRTVYRKHDGSLTMNTSRKGDEGKRWYATVTHNKELSDVLFWDRKNDIWSEAFRDLM